jgi:predicted nucleic acid-binding protein
VDSSVWVAHFRKRNILLQSLLSTDQVLCHPLIIVELACGTPPAPRARTLGALRKLQRAVISTTEGTLELIEKKQLQNSGCAAVDVALLASTLLTSNARLWTLDKDLGSVAAKMGVAFQWS